MRAKQRPRAFTLIELLVVVAIIGILASMLLPVLTRARDSVKAVACLNNQKQIAVAMEMSSGDHDDSYILGYLKLDQTTKPANAGQAYFGLSDFIIEGFPPDPVFTNNPSGYSVFYQVGFAWFIAHDGYLSSTPDIFRCPSDRRRSHKEAGFVDDQYVYRPDSHWSRNSYTLNSHFSRTRVGQKVGSTADRPKQSYLLSLTSADDLPMVVEQRSSGNLFFGWMQGVWCDPHGNYRHPMDSRSGYESLEWEHDVPIATYGGKTIAGPNHGSQLFNAVDIPKNFMNIAFLDGHAEQVKDTYDLIERNHKAPALDTALGDAKYHYDRILCSARN